MVKLRPNTPTIWPRNRGQQRAIRNMMTDHAGFHNFAHAYDLKSLALSARDTLEAALERRETRGAYNRSDYPATDNSQQVNRVWSASIGVTREEIATIPDEISELICDMIVEGKLVE